MAHRKERLSSFIREVVSDAIANRISDPRVHRLTSVTRVELSPDLRVADVYVSVLGSENQGRTTIRGLHSARGMIQTRLAKQVNMRQCPILRFQLDEELKAAISTIRAIDDISTEDAGGDANDDDDDAGFAAADDSDSEQD